MLPRWRWVPCTLLKQKVKTESKSSSPSATVIARVTLLDRRGVRKETLGPRRAVLSRMMNCFGVRRSLDVRLNKEKENESNCM
jgi:hypothetical protein